jgi:hypothetical protein
MDCTTYGVVVTKSLSIVRGAAIAAVPQRAVEAKAIPAASFFMFFIYFLLGLIKNLSQLLHMTGTPLFTN